MVMETELTAGALEVVRVDGRVLLAGMCCDELGATFVELRDPSSGEVLHTHRPTLKPGWMDPAESFQQLEQEGRPYLLYTLPRHSGFEVLSISPSGLEVAEQVFPDDGFSALAPARVDGRLAVAVADAHQVRFHAWQESGRVLRTWKPPPGWEVGKLLFDGASTSAWLHNALDVPLDEERWKYLAAHSRRWVWDAVGNAPIGEPTPLVGYEWGPWQVNGRAVLLIQRGWRDFTVWDPRRGEALGPEVPGFDLSAPSLGVLHGRAVLAAVKDRALGLWDLGTGWKLAVSAAAEGTVATASEGHTTWCLHRSRRLTSVETLAAQLHPSAQTRTP